jgi:hypothetical protein
MRSAGLVNRFDNGIIDGAVDGLAGAVRGLGSRLRNLQRGGLQQGLALSFAATAVVVVLYLLLS